MKTRVHFIVLLMISCLTGFTQVLPIIHQDGDFEWKEYKSPVDFHSEKFDSTANFKYAQFDSTADFFGAQFNSTADFSGVQFDSSAYFFGTKFDSIASFRGANIQESIYFDDSTLPYLLDLSGIRIKEGNLDLTNSTVNKKYGKCRINLVNVDIEKVILRYSMFELDLPDSLNSDTKTNVFERLLKTQKDNGFTSSFEKLDKEYAAFKYLKSGKYSSIGGWILNMVNKYWWGYGYDKTLIIVNTLLIFVLFSLINCIFFPWILNIYEVPNIKSLASAVTAKNVFLQRIKTLPVAFFYTGLIFFGLKFSTENLKYKENLIGWRVFNLVYFFVIYISGLVCLGYLANFILST